MVCTKENWDKGEPDDTGGIHGEADIPEKHMIITALRIFMSDYLASLKFSGIFLALTAWTVQSRMRIML